MQIKSVHLESFPNIDEKIINNDIVLKMNLAKEICGNILSVRKKHNMSVKIPILQVNIYSKILESFYEYLEIIKEECNIKNILILNDNFEEIAKIEYKINFNACGKKFGLKIKEIQQEIANKNFILNDKKELLFTALNVVLAENEYEILYLPKDLETEIQPCFDNKILLQIDLKIDKNSILEYHSRRIIRTIQNQRKINKFELNYKIPFAKIFFYNNEIEEAFNLYKDLIKSETLINDIVSEKKDIDDFEVDFFI